MKETEPQTIGRYQIAGLLGAGGMGSVYKAHDPRLQRDVAIKVMHSYFANLPEFRVRFLQEGITAARLSHPGIVPVYDSGEDSGKLYIVMELILGDNLRRVISRLQAAHRALFLSEAVQLAGQVCLSMDHAHRQGVLHRDIKPENIILKPDHTEDLRYQPILTDLGLGKLLEELHITSPGETLGTPAYMSPEQALGERMDARSDVYSLAILAYELAAGRLPFPAKTATEARRYHTRESPPSPSSLRPDIPEALEQVILKGLEKNPRDRFQTAREMAKALQATLFVLKAAEAGEGAGAPVGKPAAVRLVELYSPATTGGEALLKIKAPGQLLRAIPIPRGGLSIGSDPDNDLVLDDPKISWRHARLDFDGENYRVEDLDSLYGTFLAGTRLQPHHPERWLAGHPLLLGDSWLYLDQIQTPPKKQELIAPDGTQVDPSRIVSSVGAANIGVYLENTRIRAAAGETVHVPVIIFNQGPVVDAYRVSVTGISTEWIRSPAPEVRLNPGNSQEASLTIQPPRLPQSRAGEHALAIRVDSLANPDEQVEVQAVLEIAPFYQFSLDMHPQKQSSAQGAFRVHLSNLGNADLTMELEATDPEEACLFSFTPPRPSLPAGEKQEAQLAIRPRAPLPNEQSRSFPFTVTARPVESRDLAHQASGEWVKVPPEAPKPVPIPTSPPAKPRSRWALGILIVLNGLIALFYLFFSLVALVFNPVYILTAAVFLPSCLLTIFLVVKAIRSRGANPDPRWESGLRVNLTGFTASIILSLIIGASGTGGDLALIVLMLGCLLTDFLVYRKVKTPRQISG